MSHCIEVGNRKTECMNPKDILRGIVSRISDSQSSHMFSKSSHQRYFKRNISQKVEIETQESLRLFDRSLMVNFQRVKSKLSLYGKTGTLKLEGMFQKEQTANTVQQKRVVRLKYPEPERIIFISRKYNKELSLKASLLSELEGIDKIKSLKQNYRLNHSLDIENDFRRLAAEANEKKKPRASNPVLRMVKTGKMQKRVRGKGGKAEGGKDRLD